MSYQGATEERLDLIDQRLRRIEHLLGTVWIGILGLAAMLVLVLMSVVFA